MVSAASFHFVPDLLKSLLLDRKYRAKQMVRKWERDMRGTPAALVGVMLRRPGVSMKATSALVLKSGRLACHRIIIDNAGGGGAAITIHHGT